MKNRLLKLKQKIKELISFLEIKLMAQEIHYINGPETLPPPLTKAEEQELMKRISLGDDCAREKLIVHNLRLVVYIAKKFENTNSNVEDLVSIGSIGLIKAVDCFDLNQNVQFSTYGVPMIAGELRRFLRDHGAIRVSRSMRDTAYRVLQAKERLTNETGRAVSAYRGRRSCLRWRPSATRSLCMTPYIVKPGRARRSWTR